jgi:hypothetical protein
MKQNSKNNRRLIFVFGSNMQGIHGAGAAKYAKIHYGAKSGVGQGLTGDAYAIPTCSQPGVPLEDNFVIDAIAKFRDFAAANPDMDFLLTAVGCGLAGFSPQLVSYWVQIHDMPNNVYVQSKLFNA